MLKKIKRILEYLKSKENVIFDYININNDNVLVISEKHMVNIEYIEIMFDNTYSGEITKWVKNNGEWDIEKEIKINSFEEIQNFVENYFN